MRAYKACWEYLFDSNPAATLRKVKWRVVTLILIGLFPCLLAQSYKGAKTPNLGGFTLAISIAHADQGTAQATEQRSKWTPLWYLQRILATLAGIFCLYLGYKLFVLGVSGKASLSIEAKGIKGQLINASPGLFFALFGMALIAIVTCRT